MFLERLLQSESRSEMINYISISAGLKSVSGMWRDGTMRMLTKST